MTAPEPSTGTRDLAEKVARARWERRRVEEDFDLTWEQLGPIFHKSNREEAAQWLADMADAGLAVVELPEPDAVADHSEIGVRRATFGPIDGQAYLDEWPDTLSGWEIAYHSQGFSTDEDVDRLVAALLGARAWAKRERAAWAEHKGGESR